MHAIERAVMKKTLALLFLAATFANGQTVGDLQKTVKDAEVKASAAEAAARLKITPPPTPAPASKDELKTLQDAVTAASNDPSKAGVIRVLAFHLQRGALTSPEARSFTAQLKPRPTPAFRPPVRVTMNPTTARTPHK
jgi:hypothetical protein